jgi:DNA-binding NtrC family response regulator
MKTILIVEDEEIKRTTLADFLGKKDYDVFVARDGQEGLHRFKEVGPDIVIADLRLPGMDGMELLGEIKRISPQTAVVMITAFATVETAVEAMRMGAEDYLTKPFGLDELLIIIKRIEELQNLKAENIALKERLRGIFSFHQLVGKSAKMVEVYKLIEAVADTQSTVLIHGENGTGKELVANAIHYQSSRRDGPLVKVSCAMLSENLLESELFGHEKGAFTGAHRRRLGRFELANKGSILLDDVDDIPPAIQVKLLRVLQEREFDRVGGSSPVSVDVRVIAATKVDLKKKVSEGNFREDLFFRLNVIPIRVPPLRERREDIELLVNYFLDRFTSRMDKKGLKVDAEAMEYFLDYPWPGNVRELENCIERMVTLARGDRLDVDSLPAEIRLSPDSISFADLEKLSKGEVSYNQIMEEVEKRLVNWALDEAGGNKSRAADMLGLKRTTFYDKMAKYYPNNRA